MKENSYFNYELEMNDEQIPVLKADPCPNCESRIFTVTWKEGGQFVGYPKDHKDDDDTCELDDWHIPDVKTLHCDNCHTDIVDNR